MKCFDRIDIKDPQIEKDRIITKIILDGKSEFKLIFKYEERIDSIENIRNISRLIVSMPLINYGLFTDEMNFDFPLTEEDKKYIKDNMGIISRDIFVNKICRRRADFIKKEYIPKEDEIKPENSETRARLNFSGTSEEKFNSNFDSNTAAILSSGGKESLLTYGLLKELGANVYPIFFNESGGHWRTALPAYKYMSTIEKNTKKVWSNVDRFYLFMLDHMKIIREDHRKVKADTYPIRLFIFGPYIFSMLPLFIRYGIGNILLGSEYDDPRTDYYYYGIKHYYGIYDQSVDFDNYNTEYFKSKGISIKQWSIVRPITGLIVERILIKRYHDLYRYQRSCHSCHIEGKEIVPCGKCTKCLGVMSFILANDGDPREINYKDQHIADFVKNVSRSPLRLDKDEKEHTFYLLSKRGFELEGIEHPHVEMLHFDGRNSPMEHIPDRYREVFKIYKEYVKGAVVLKNDEFVPIDFFSMKQ
ncbi:MAG: hypothetical protein QXT18_03225 [Thermoplasmata archaeon]